MTRRPRHDKGSSSPRGPHSGRGRKPATEDERKDRVIQTRVPKDLESTLKDAAESKRMTVSHLIRNVLEDTFRLVDGIVADSSALVENVTRDARKLAASARGEGQNRAAGPEGEDLPQAAAPSVAPAADAPSRAAPASDSTTPALDTVDAWQDVIVNRPGQCAACNVALGRGQRAFRGLTGQSQGPAIWLCPACIEKL